MVEVNARLQQLVGGVLVDVEGTDDVGSPTGKALPVLDAEARASLTLVVTRLTSLLAELQLKADLTEPQPVSAVDLDIRNLVNATDSVRAVDAAETTGLTAVPFTVTATGVTTLVAAPGGGSLLRLRRLSPTFAIRSPNSEPILQLKVGTVEVQRGNALVGRFDETAAASSDAITLTVDILDAGGKVTGTAYYETV